jgi:hypothetical protein
MASIYAAGDARKKHGSADEVIFRQTVADQFEIDVNHMNRGVNHLSWSRPSGQVILRQSQDGSSQDFGREP